MSTLVAYVQLSPAITMPVSGVLCESSMRWPSVFYTHGIAGIILFTIFAAFYRNSPAKHRCVGAVELAKISVGKSSLDKKELRKPPYKAILRTTAVWAVWLAALGNFMAVSEDTLISTKPDVLL